MGSYVVSTKEEQQQMLKELGMEKIEELFAQVPEEVKFKGTWKLPKGLSELEVRNKMQEIAEKNRVFSHIFRGAGAYDHYIPSIVKTVISKEEFVTAYTPYQAEISQGILQSIFEYQSMICELTGMDVSNASVYDGATAAAEAAAMCRERKKDKILVSSTSNPEVVEVIKTYCYGNGMECHMVPQKQGHTDMEALEAMLTEDTAGFYVQEPNYYGILEDYEAMGRMVHSRKARYIMGCNPIALAVLKTPGEYGADIAVGEGQPLGMELGFGGPYLGFMASTKEMMRRLPGRMVGETADEQGRRTFVLTLQAREQHIRREKAGSNVCSNQAHCALTAAVYLSAMGAVGLREAAKQSAARAHELQKALEKLGFLLKYPSCFFHEFVTESKVPSEIVVKALEERGYLGGLPLSESEILWCATEKNTKQEIEFLTEVLKEVCEVWN